MLLFPSLSPDYTSSSVLIDTKTGAASPGGEMLKRRAYYSVQVFHGILYFIDIQIKIFKYQMQIF